jgi:ABC-type multidrug transport system ATPase subunit
MIELFHVTQHYGIRPVLRDIHLTIESGKLTAIVGPNGMGKSTLLAVMAGVLMPQRGYAAIDGIKWRQSEEDELRLRQTVVYLPDHPWLPLQRTGREFLLGVGRIYGIESERLLEQVELLLQLFDLTAHGDWPIRGYSNGQKKKIAIASALITEAPVLLLDEPFAGGLDPAGILALQRVLLGLVEHPQRTIVATAPVPELVEQIGQRIVVLRDGTVVAHDTLDGLRQLTGCKGPLAEILGRLTHPHTLEDAERYLKGFLR